MNLSAKEQDRLLLQSYLTANYLLAISGVNDESSKSGPREMFACMKDRDIPWIRKTYKEYAQKHPTMAKHFSQNLSQSIAWKCGLLSFAEE